MQRATMIAAVLLVGLCGLAWANPGPCITCVQCNPTDAFCLSQCKTSCPKPPPPQPAVTVDVRMCSVYGADQGRAAAQQACNAALQYCTGSPGGLIVGSGAPQVSLTQCANAAFGVCESTALSHASSPCAYAFNGYAKCNAQQFMNFYAGDVKSQCHASVQWIRDVNSLLKAIGLGRKLMSA